MYYLFLLFFLLKDHLGFSWVRYDSAGAQYMRIPVRDFLAIRIVKTP